MRNKIVKKMRKVLKPLVNEGVLVNNSTYIDDIRPHPVFDRMITNDNGERKPIFKTIDKLFNRTLHESCLKYHVKRMKDYYLHPDKAAEELLNATTNTKDSTGDDRQGTQPEN